MNEKPSIGIIGRGYWGSKVINYVADHFNCNHYIGNNNTKLNDLMNNRETKNVYIITPIETHYDLCKTALLNNKNVFCEKPITLNSDQAYELEELAKERDLHLAVEYTHTFSKSIKFIRDICVPRYGNVEYYEMNSKHLGRFMEHNVYWLLASHFLAVLDLFEDIDKFVFSKKDRLFFKDVCTTGTITFDKGRIDTSLNYVSKDSSASFYFKNATAIYNPLAETKKSLQVIEYNNKYKAVPPELIEYEEYPGFDEKNNLNLALKYFKDLLAGREKSNLSTAIKVTKILENLNELQRN